VENRKLDRVAFAAIRKAVSFAQMRFWIARSGESVSPRQRLRCDFWWVGKGKRRARSSRKMMVLQAVTRSLSELWI
jgi:hypothetical protein